MLENVPILIAAHTDPADRCNDRLHAGKEPEGVEDRRAWSSRRYRWLLSLLMLTEFSADRRHLPVRRELHLDLVAGHILQSRRRRHKHPHGLPDHPAVVPGRPVLLGCRRADPPVHGPDAHAGGRRHGSVHGAGLLPVLRLLGGRADPDVLPHQRYGEVRGGPTRRSSSSYTPTSPSLVMLLGILALYFEAALAPGAYTPSTCRPSRPSPASSANCSR